MNLPWFDLSMGGDDSLPGTFFADRWDFFGLRKVYLEFGNPADNWNPDSWLRSSKPSYDGPVEDIIDNCLNLPVFSPRLVKAIAAADVASRDIQYLPVTLFRSNGERIDGCQIANIVTRLPALDRQRTTGLEVDEDKTDPLTNLPGVAGFFKPALIGSVLEGHDVIRLTEFFSSVFVSQRFVDLFHSMAFTGATFRERIVT